MSTRTEMDARRADAPPATLRSGSPVGVPDQDQRFVVLGHLHKRGAHKDGRDCVLVVYRTTGPPERSTDPDPDTSRRLDLVTCFLSLAQGERQALRLLSDFAAALGWGERDLRAYEPRPLAQAYPACLAGSALFGTCSGVALAMLANLEEWGGYCGRVAQALLTRYGLPEQAAGFFRFFAGSPPGWPRARTRRRRCGRRWPCTRMRSRSGTRSPTASADRRG
jgi:hypothetical protein